MKNWRKEWCKRSSRDHWLWLVLYIVLAVLVGGFIGIFLAVMNVGTW